MLYPKLNTFLFMISCMGFRPPPTSPTFLLLLDPVAFRVCVVRTLLPTCVYAPTDFMSIILFLKVVRQGLSFIDAERQLTGFMTESCALFSQQGPWQLC